MISIVIVSYNTDRHLRSCLESISQHGGSSSYEVIVVNNGSPLEAACLQCPGVNLRVINNHKNIGYAAALNQGAMLSEQPYLLCLNADTRVPSSSLEPLVDYLETHPEAGVVAPRLVYPDGTLQYSCRREYTYGSIVGRRVPLGLLPMVEPALRHHLMLDEDHERILKPDWIQGSCMMIPRAVLEQLNGFDERFFLYFEDYDFCKRIRRNGYEVVYLPESEVTHFYARSSASLSLFRREFWHHATSALRYYRKNLRPTA